MFGRVITAMATPFTKTGEIDWIQLEKLIEHLIKTGSDSLVVSGTTAESPTLTHSEKLELFRFAVKTAAGRVKIIAGTGSNNTQQSIELSRQAAACDVDALMLVAPYYNKPSQEAMIQHFQAIAERTELPIVLYNVPGRTSSNLLPATVAQLAEHQNIVAVKEASGDIDQISLLARLLPDDVVIYSGDDSLTLPILSIGGVGVISVASHLFGLELQEMIQSYEQGNVKRALELHQQLYPAFKGLFLTSSPAPLKYAMSELGLCEPTLRLPLIELNQQEKEAVKEWLYSLR
ncbi:dihydrodipicolinate synthase [Seinonella peptonophila]|uniref:4-hydroxy-tetrahydrodipicolinate synthase n=1 Tax=Seinonella peptonophila TaxID=112248 RepID=A0A1M5ARN7_9BACL|nr:4-hydroxy-tetrahydrodipicolinate synthase [Seinonella peptonophila]SHF32582.1 dihydrodipicolinate synthase [Seinonella peptonophila]